MSAVLPALTASIGAAGLMPAAARPTQWYVLYTCSRHEKQVATHLQEREVEFFLPQYQSTRRWKDRRVKLQLPLFPGYIFVHTSLQHHVKVLSVPGAVRFVSFQGRPAPLHESDLLRLRAGLDQGLCAEPHPYLKIGRRVRVRSGPLTGMEGILVRKKDRFRLVISIDLILRSVAVEIDATDIEPIA